MQNHCAAPNCANGKANYQPLFRFPKDTERCKKWIEKCNRADLKDKSPDELYRYYRICVKHFDASSCDNNSLKDDAVPSIFDMSSQPNSTQLKRDKAVIEAAETEIKMRKKVKTSQTETNADRTQAPSEEEEYKDYLKSLFEVLVLLGEQNIPVQGPVDDKREGLTSSNFMELLEYRMNAGDEALKRRCEADAAGGPSTILNQLIEVCERCIRTELLDEVGKNRFFSLVTENVVKISEEWHLPVFLRYVDQTNSQQEKFVGFLNFEGDGETLAEKLLSDLTDKWGLNLEQCRAQAHCCSGSHYSKIKVFAAKLKDKYPKAVLTPRSTSPLNISLAKSMALSGVQLVMSTFNKIESFFNNSPSLQMELEHAISIFYSDKEEKANELKELCHPGWTTRHEAFEVAVDIIESLLLCVDSVHDNEDIRWNDQVIQDALEISKALADFEFIMALVVLKSTLSLTRAFGTNLQGSAEEAHFAANNFKPVLQSLLEVSQNIDVYHEFWYDEAFNLAATLEVPVRVPRSFSARHRLASGSSTQPEHYYKGHVSVPVVEHVIREIKDLFCEEHLKALGCQSLVPALLGQSKFTEPEEENVRMYKDDIPNAGTLPAELHCWWVKWKGPRGKGAVVPSSLRETLQLADVKFFPNMLAVLRVIGTLPTFALEGSGDLAYRRFQRYMRNTPDGNRSSSLALLNVNIDVRHDLDSMVRAYMKAYPDGEKVQ